MRQLLLFALFLAIILLTPRLEAQESEIQPTETTLTVAKPKFSKWYIGFGATTNDVAALNDFLGEQGAVGAPDMLASVYFAFVIDDDDSPLFNSVESNISFGANSSDNINLNLTEGSVSASLGYSILKCSHHKLDLMLGIGAASSYQVRLTRNNAPDSPITSNDLSEAMGQTSTISFENSGNIFQQMYWQPRIQYRGIIKNINVMSFLSYQRGFSAQPWRAVEANMPSLPEWQRNRLSLGVLFGF
ncbi:MAG: hypothetical protein JJT94_04865 [Bernardetiaceae bacterium]|nr:hypothetical protein [Bernardetiaceae bacterium]